MLSSSLGAMKMEKEKKKALELRRKICSASSGFKKEYKHTEKKAVLHNSKESFPEMTWDHKAVC